MSTAHLASRLLFLLTLTSSGCLDPQSALLDLDLPLCTSPEVRERYLRGETLAQLQELRGVWSLQIQRCLFKSAEVTEELDEWRSVLSEPFILDLNEGNELVSLPSAPEDSPPSITPLTASGRVALTGEPVSSLSVTLDDFNSERVVIDSTYQLRFEGGVKLVISPAERAQYQSQFERLTGTVFIPGQGQVGVFTLTQHPVTP